MAGFDGQGATAVVRPIAARRPASGSAVLCRPRDCQCGVSYVVVSRKCHDAFVQAQARQLASLVGLFVEPRSAPFAQRFVDAVKHGITVEEI
jgi:hypothetical protein